jgi:hypothetical protein
MRQNAKRRRRNNSKQPLEKTNKRAIPMDLSGLILPKSGDKTVAGEAFEKLSSSQKKSRGGECQQKNEEGATLH